MSRLRRWSVALPAFGVVAAGGCGLLARHDQLAGAAAGQAVGAVTTLVVGSWLLRRQLRPDGETALRLVGLALVVWGVSLGMNAAAVVRGPLTFPTGGDDLSSVASGLALIALVLNVRGRTVAIDLVRLTLDGLLLAGASMVSVWRGSLSQSLFTASVSHSVSLQALAVVAVDLLAVAFMALVALRDADRCVVFAVVGMAAGTLGDLLRLQRLGVPGASWPWQLGPLTAVAAVALSMAALGLRSMRGGSGRGPVAGDDRAGARVSAATTVVSLLLVVTMIARHPYAADTVTRTLMLTVVLVFAAREVVGNLQRGALLRRLTVMAYRDPLTSLGNRRSLALRHRALTGNGQASLLTLDLDGFKEVNDSLGHARGDALLVAVTARVRGCLPRDVEAFRVGGDEFAVVVPGDDGRACAVAERLLLAVRQASHDVPGASGIHVSASIGVADLAPPVRPDRSRLRLGRGTGRGADGRGAREADDSDVLRSLVESGVALRAAKSAGRDRVERYDGPVAARHRRAQMVERRLRKAIAAGGVVAHFQPVVDLSTRRVVGFEALARWDDDDLGRVPPDEFIPVAERSGQIIALGTAVADHALRASAHLASRHPELGALSMAVNASVVQLRRAGFAGRVLAACDLHGVAPQNVVVEVTESLFIDLDDPALRELAQLRSQLVNVAIDDFGSGYSSLAYLSRVPANIVKLDRALVSCVVSDPRARSIVSSIATLARGLPMDVVMEGIETADVHRAVVEAGGSLGQGWLYGAAVPLADVAALVHRINDAARSPLVLR